jgi:formate dehydrogenase subunit gamma
VLEDISQATHRIIDSYRDVEGPALPILHALQEEFGYLPEEALPIVAHALNITRAEIYGVATFYHDFRLKPRGRHTLTLCRAEACQAMGGEALAKHAQARLGVMWGETSPDGRVTLEQTFCLGLCSCAPSAMLNGQLLGRLTPEKLDAALGEAQR